MSRIERRQQMKQEKKEWIKQNNSIINCNKDLRKGDLVVSRVFTDTVGIVVSPIAFYGPMPRNVRWKNEDGEIGKPPFKKCWQVKVKIISGGKELSAWENNNYPTFGWDVLNRKGDELDWDLGSATLPELP